MQYFQKYVSYVWAQLEITFSQQLPILTFVPRMRKYGPPSLFIAKKTFPGFLSKNYFDKISSFSNQIHLFMAKIKETISKIAKILLGFAPSPPVKW